MTDYTTLRFEVREQVAWITLDRPDAANALDQAMARELLEVSGRCDTDRDVRAVVLTGTGKVFSPGGDLKSFASQEDLPVHLKTVTMEAHAAISRFSRMRAPVIAAVNGTAAGFGMSLVAASDLAIAADSARFTLAYTRVGLTPDGSASYALPRTVGLKRAMEIALTNPVLTAQQALEWGLINRVSPADTLVADAAQWAKEVAAGATEAMASAKRLIRQGADMDLESQMEDESRTIAAIARTQDAREGIAAFLEKRAAIFTGV